jgi:hypothetical protein
MLRNESVKTNPQEDYLHYHNDGMLDIFIGVGILVIGLGMLTEIYYVFIAILPAIMIPVWRDAKNKYTAPRMKYIHFAEADCLARRTTALLTGLLLAGMLVFLAGAMAAFLWSQSNGTLSVKVIDTIREYYWLLLGGCGALTFSAIASLYKQKRFFVYAVLTLAVYTSAYALSMPFWLTIILIGTTITISGSVVLLRFMQAYPIDK